MHSEDALSPLCRIVPFPPLPKPVLQLLPLLHRMPGIHPWRPYLFLREAYSSGVKPRALARIVVAMSCSWHPDAEAFWEAPMQAVGRKLSDENPSPDDLAEVWPKASPWAREQGFQALVGVLLDKRKFSLGDYRESLMWYHPAFPGRQVDPT